MKKFLAILGVGVAVAVSSGCATTGKPSKIEYATLQDISIPVETRVLDNGLTVILHVDHTSPFVAVHVRYRVGSADETPGKDGLAHLVEHLMFWGSRHVAAGQHFDELLLAAMSTDSNAETGFDATNYHETLPSNRLETALWLESDRMAYPIEKVSQQTFTRERSVVENELRERYASGPYTASGLQLNDALFAAGHPYHHTPIGSEQTLESLTLADAQAFVSSWYRPNNAVLVIVGDVQPKATWDLVEKYFKPIVPKVVPLRAKGTPESWGETEKRIRVEHGGGKPFVGIGWILPPEYAEGTTAMRVAGGSLDGWLTKAAVDDDKVADEVQVSIDTRRLSSVLYVIASVREKHTPEEVLASLDRALDKARAPKFSWARFGWQVRRASVSMGVVYSLESFSSRASMISQYEDLAGSPDFAGRDLHMLRNVLPEEARDAYYQYLPFDHRVVGFFMPVAGAPREGRLAQ